MYTLNPNTIKLADAIAVKDFGISELILMKNAAKSCFEYIYRSISSDDRIVILCGKGNNGGDGYEIARILKKEWFNVTVINVFETPPVTPTAMQVYKDCMECGVQILGFSTWEESIKEATVIIDAIFGVGFYGEIDKNGEIGKMLDFCNCKNAKRIAIDTPSGINSADGRVDGIAFMADFTVTMAYVKTGMLSYPAREYCGEIKVADIGYPNELCESIEKDALIPDDEYVYSVLPKRHADSHKGTYGRLLMYCGSRNMTGAAILSANAALRSGAGLVNIARDENTIRILQSHLVEPVFSVISDKDKEREMLSLSEKASAILIGCGMGTLDDDKKVLFSLIKNASCNIIIDADGINCLGMNKLILKEAKQTPVLTPHPLEFARLIGTDAENVQKNRINLARDFAKEYGCVIVLKGAATVIASPDGRLCINTTGNPGLSKGGSGDVLAGLISSFCAQGISPFDSAALAVYIHGKAADILAERISEYGLLPSDLPMEIAKLLP